MSELIYYDEVRPLAEIDTTNPLSDYVKLALLPNQGSGNDLVDIASNQTLTFADGGNASNALLWNADGSISQTVDTAGYNVNADTHLGMISAYSTSLLQDITPNTESFIFSFNTFINHQGTTHPCQFFKMRYYSLGKGLKVYRPSWSQDIVFLCNDANVTYTPTSSGNFNFTIVVDNPNNTFTVYKDGAILGSSSVLNDYTSNVNLITLGVGKYTDKFYSSMMLQKTGSFTTAEIDEIVTNPYQLFKTQQDVQQEYGLKLSEEIHGIVVDGLVGNINVEYELASNLTTATGNSYLYIIDGRKILGDTVNYTGAGYLYTSGFNGISNFTLNGTASTKDGLLQAVKNDVCSFDMTATAIGNGTIELFNRFSENEAAITQVKWIKITDDNGLHYFSLNQTNGSTVQSLTSSLVATLNNFPADSGYIRDASTGLISGYKANGADTSSIVNVPLQSHTKWSCKFTVDALPVDGGNQCLFGGRSQWGKRLISLTRTATNVNINIWLWDSTGASASRSTSVAISNMDNRYPDNPNRFDIEIVQDDSLATRKTEIYVNGYAGWRDINDTSRFGDFEDLFHDNTNYGELEVIGAIEYWNNESATPVLVFNWDFTTGDDDSIPDTISGNNATINNVKTSGFMPVLSKQVYNVKVDGTGDYNSFANFVGGVVGSDNTVHYVANIYDFLTEKLTTVGWTNRFLNLTVQAAMGYEFKGNINQGAGFDTSALGTVFFDVRQTAPLNYLIKDLRFYDGNTGGWGSSWSVGTLTGSRIQLTNCGFKADPHWKTSNSYYFLVKPEFSGKNLLIVDYPRLTYAGKALSIDDSIYVGNGLTTRVIAAGSMVTNLVYDNGTTAIIDASSVPASTNALVDVNGLNYFTDPTNGDYTINTTGQAALAGQGWNGSDIAGWAYAVASGLTRISKDFILMASAYEKKSINFQQLFNALSSLSAVSKNFTILLTANQRDTANYSAILSLLERAGKIYQGNLSLNSRISRNYSVFANLLEKISKNQTVNISTFERVLKDYKANLTLLVKESVSHNFNVTALEKKSKNFSMLVDKFYRETLASTFNMTLLQREYVDYATLLSLYEKKSHGHGIKVDLMHRDSKQSSFVFNLLSQGHVSSAFTIMVSLQERMQKAFGAKMTLLERAFADHQFVINTLQKEVKDFSIVSNLLERVATDYAAVISANEKVSSDYTISLSSISRVGKIYDIVFTLEGDGLPLTPAHYVLGVGGVVDFSSGSVAATNSGANSGVILQSDKPIIIKLD